MELVIALSIIFSVIALFTAIYACEELIKLQNRMEGILEELMKQQDRIERILKTDQIYQCYRKLH